MSSNIILCGFIDDTGEQSNPKWISTELHKKYFGYLSDNNGVRTIIGMLPGTTQTAMQLKRILNKARLIIVSAKKWTSMRKRWAL